MAEIEARFDLEPGPLAPRLARQQVTMLLKELSGIDRDEVGLLVSELVTNAVTHAESMAQVHVQADEGRLRIEVADRSPTRPLVRPVDHSASSGRGLQIVATLADRWGVLEGDGEGGEGKAVWFELDRGPAD